MIVEDTIVSSVTAPGDGAVSIVRLSGEQSFAIADTLFQCNGAPLSQRKAYTFVYGTIIHEGEHVDEALALLFRAPQSYTCEDVIEFQVHGGGRSAERVIRACLDLGARVAEAGEFTRRAFLNGRIDLVQAEAVMDLVRSDSERAQKAALQQLEGSLSRDLDSVYDALLLLAAQLEATLDFPEDELPDSVFPQLRSSLAQQQKDLAALLSTWQEGHVLRDGAVVVLSGKPNVGKSTLLNALLGRDRAIVSNIPGTTRDHIEAHFLLDGIPMNLVDTAGLRDSEDPIEREGISRSRKLMDEADLHIHLVDLSDVADTESLTALESLVPGKSILLCNKADLPRLFHVEQWPDVPRLEAALQQNQGLDELKASMKELLSGSMDLSARPHAVISERHRQVLLKVEAELSQFEELLSMEEAEEQLVLAIPLLRGALQLLGEVTGREYHEELLDQVFSSFCIGK